MNCVQGRRRQWALLLAVAAIFAVLAFFRAPCLFLRLFHIPCPGCGMTRAVTAALHLDFSAAFSYHPMFWSLPLIGLLILTDGRPTRWQWLNISALCLIGSGFLLHYIKRLLVYFGA